jgi:hypothetical protein
MKYVQKNDTKNKRIYITNLIRTDDSKSPYL